MKLGVLKDIKKEEYRVVLTPSEIATYVDEGHIVYVEKNAGAAAGFDDNEYELAGAVITDNITIYKECDFVVKVKEIEPSEYDLLRENQIVLTCIHPAAHEEEVDTLLKKKVISFAAEDTHRHGSPNCEAAGKVGAFLGLYSMMSINGGKGKFVSGLGAAPRVNALVLGCGTVGKGAIEVLYTMGANVSVMAKNVGHLREVSSRFEGKISTSVSNKYNLRKALPHIDIVVNCVRWDKSNKDYLIDREMVRSMQKGSVIVDVSNDFGVIETFHETTHNDPTYIEEGVVHYCVSNIPSAVAQSASIAYAASLNGHIHSILNHGVKEACKKDGFLRRGMVTYKGYLTHEETSQIQHRPWIQPEKILDIENEVLDPAPKNTVACSDYYYDDVKVEE
ncbi:MAG: alanine dehydrogenase [Emergencia sp.]|nr:NAD(P)-dependent oxidoreductase [Emergencia sp.]